MKIVSLANNIYTKVEKILKTGGLVIAPSDTVYGLLVDSANEKAVQKLIEFKNRPPGKAISVFVSDLEMLKKYSIISPPQTRLLQTLLPGPFTVILKSRHQTSLQLESEKGALGLRLPRYDFITGLVRRYGKAVTATSANLSGRLPHYRVDSLINDLPKNKKELIDLIVDAGTLPHNRPSTVIDLAGDILKIVRKGDLMLSHAQSFISGSENQTEKIAQFLLQKYQNLAVNKPLIFIIQGELGVGKTVLVKGIGHLLGIDNIVSPTFVVYYEYDVDQDIIHKLYHFDLYNVQSAEEFRYLGIKDILKPHTILCFEWGEKTGEIINMLKSKAAIVYITMKYINENKREIKINF